MVVLLKAPSVVSSLPCTVVRGVSAWYRSSVFDCEAGPNTAIATLTMATMVNTSDISYLPGRSGRS